MRLLFQYCHTLLMRRVTILLTLLVLLSSCS
ncbi:lipoprotein [Escherichia marmotae]|uniref:Type IV secretion system putative lipoprotein virB7 n=1 Tax=Escherichia marmotae TaxID=1499973 RepID=A0A7L6L2Z7_9ESCH|nr:lipoprotein [Escherichia coli]MBA7737003.1 lipoprotein [Escherichia marmotae]MBB2300120.1 lipoprotein [Escherichia sp. 93.1447]MBB2406911.1 lipoprotein [Escherichia sp. 14.0982]MBA7951136.1 lipoprotein [Escherichia marmotae]